MGTFALMATPAQLLNAIASATGVPLPTLVDIDRKLVKGELRTKGGRGLSAAHMTALDAARLLTAILASPQANTSVEAVERYGQTHPDKTRSSDTSFGAVKLDDLAGLPARHSFVDALEALIDSASSGSLAKLINNPKGKLGSSYRGLRLHPRHARQNPDCWSAERADREPRICIGTRRGEKA